MALQPVLALLPLLLLGCGCQAFAPSSTTYFPTTTRTRQDNRNPNYLQTSLPIINNPHSSSSTTSTRLYNGIIIDVDDNFFTFTFFSIGLFYSLGKAYNRYLLEEVAFEQRKFEARERRLEQDPSLSELDLRREESVQWPSVYGRKFRGEGETVDSGDDGSKSSRRRARVSVLDRVQEEDDDEYDDEYAMSDDEINTFESKFGVEYDPYYDEPYEENELPVGKYKEDKSYGDRRYENGEVFYKDEGSGLFYRQGSRPRQKKFWDLNSS
ncbi:hypothetical protein ACHAXR_004919 [Thalassiosira sp. AJA248-18]